MVTLIGKVSCVAVEPCKFQGVKFEESAPFATITKPTTKSKTHCLRRQELGKVLWVPGVQTSAMLLWLQYLLLVLSCWALHSGSLNPNTLKVIETTLPLTLPFPCALASLMRLLLL